MSFIHLPHSFRGANRSAERIQNLLRARADVLATTPLRLGQDLGGAGGRIHLRTPQAFRRQDSFQVVDGLVEAVVHKNIVVLWIFLNLFPGAVEATANYFL